jgi:ATPase family associated with various cellular activities (AAA)
MSNPVDRLQIFINSSTPLVIMETVEEEHALFLIRSAAYNLNLPIFEWSIADGLVRNDARIKPTGVNIVPNPQAVQQLTDFLAPGEQLSGLAAPGSIAGTQEASGVLAHLLTLNLEAIFVLKDFHRHMEDAVVVRRLREVAQLFSRDRRTIIITGPAVTIPPELRCSVEFLDLPLPDRTRLSQIVEETFNRLSKKMSLKRKTDAPDIEEMARNLSGLTELEAERAVAHAIVARYALVPEVALDVLAAKKEALRHSNMLDFIDASENLASIGGLDNLKFWLSKRKNTWSDDAKAAGLEPPRGVIILGVQGCGKSMSARAIAGEWKLPLVKFDASAIFDKFIGESEKRMDRVFRVAEQLAPCVLWIDELEKVFAGSGPDSASVDAGLSSRLLGSFLGWMQDRKAPVFVAATCNNVSALPPELIRKGRFDELFFVDLPTTGERRAIFSVQLAKRKLKPADFNLDQLVAASPGFSGAEIEAAIKSAQYAVFTDKRFLDTDFILTELKSTVPLSATRAEEIEELRDWAQKRAVPASLPEAKLKSVGAV